MVPTARPASTDVVLQVSGVNRRTHELCARVCSGTPRYQHVRGHVGDRYNELAYLLAKEAGKGRCLSSFDWQPSRRAIAATVPCRTHGAGDDTFHAGMTATEMVAPFLAHTPPREDAQSVSFGVLGLRIVSFNTLTLAGSATDPDVVGAVPEAELLEQHAVQVADLQETRCPAGQLTTGEYLRFCSGGSGGCFGCELWFRKGSNLIQGPGCKGRVCFQDGCFIVLHTTPRCLVVQFSAAGTRISFASIHRATESDKLEQRWHESTAILRHCAATSALVICGDCNASDHRP